MKFNSILLSLTYLIGGQLAASDNYDKMAEFDKLISTPRKIAISHYAGSRSHVKYLLEISTYLSQQGHQIIYASTSNQQNFADGYNVTKFNMGKITKDPIINTNREFDKWLISHYEPTLKEHKRLHKEHDDIDLIICDWFAASCFDFFKSIGKPVIVGYQGLGFDVEPAPYLTKHFGIDPDFPLTTDELSFFRRYYETFLKRDPRYKIRKSLMDGLNENRKKFNFPLSSNTLGDTDTTLKLADTFIGWEIARPIHPTLQLVGPIRSPSVTNLTDSLRKFLDIHDQTLYIAFGSHGVPSTANLELLLTACFQLLEDEVFNGVILATTAPHDKFPQKIQTDKFIKEREKLVNNKYNNFVLEKYAPQEAILKHASTKVFLTHAGLESVYEGIFTSTPMVAIPFMGDQPRNGQTLIRNGIGAMVNKDKDTVEEFISTIKKIKEDSSGSVHNNLLRMRTLAYYNSLGVKHAGDLILSHVNTAKVCRKSGKVPEGIPCEVQHLVSLDQVQSKFYANQWDIYVFHYSIIGLGVSLVLYTVYFLYSLYNGKFLGYKMLKDQ